MKKRYSVKKGKLTKAASENVPVSRMRLGEIGFTGLKSESGVIVEHCHNDLKAPNHIKTFKNMSMDSTIRSANNIYDLMISRAKFRFVAPDGAPKESKDAADFLNYCKDNLEGQSWKDFVSEVGSMKIYGYHVAEKVYKKVEEGEYRGKIKWKKLATRGQETIKEWLWDESGQELKGLIQDTTLIYDTNRFSKFAGKTEVPIDRKKFMLFRFDPKRDNPEGTSPLEGCYIAWKYKTIIEEYQAVGVAKDLGGIPVIGIHVEALNKAVADPSSIEAKNLEALQEMAENLHAGEKTYAIKPIAYDDNGRDLYTFDLVGISGSGKQYNTSDIIRQYQNEILTVYTASLIKLGQDASGSFALSDNMNNLLGHGVEHHINLIEDQINNDLIPQTLALNGWRLPQKHMPKLIHEDIAEISLDEFGKLVQRAVTSGAMTRTKELDRAIYRRLNLSEPQYEDDEKIPEEFASENVSNAGEGNGTSGTGNSQDAVGGDMNVENAE